MRNVYKVLYEKPEGKSPIRRRRLRQYDNIKMEMQFRDVLT
jgi:DNA-dependent RNA polymerase auxiliary subunit epsilon